MSDAAHPCPLQYFCPGEITEPLICPSGLLCNETGLSAGWQCPETMYCIEGSSAPTLCPDGYACPAGTIQPLPCPSGAYCLAGIAVVCPGARYCPAGTSFPVSCEGGFYCVEGSSNQTECPAAAFCGLESSAFTPCPPSYFCPAGSPLPTLCPSASFCPYESAAFQPCTAGLFCGAGVSDGATCPVGFFCPYNTSVPLPCAPGVLCLQGSVDESVPCPGGMTCNGAEIALCPAGQYCVEGSFEGAMCPSGSFCSAGISAPVVCDPGILCLMGSVDDKNPCPPGMECMYGMASICPGGVFCPMGSYNGVACPAGGYCPQGSAAPVDCPTAAFCPAGASDPTPCPGGYFCQADSPIPVPCPEFFYCPPSSDTPITCPDTALCPAVAPAPCFDVPAHTENLTGLCGWNCSAGFTVNVDYTACIEQNATSFATLLDFNVGNATVDGVFLSDLTKQVENKSGCGVTAECKAVVLSITEPSGNVVYCEKGVCPGYSMDENGQIIKGFTHTTTTPMETAAAMAADAGVTSIAGTGTSPTGMSTWSGTAPVATSSLNIMPSTSATEARSSSVYVYGVSNTTLSSSARFLAHEPLTTTAGSLPIIGANLEDITSAPDEWGVTANSMDMVASSDGARFGRRLLQASAPPVPKISIGLISVTPVSANITFEITIGTFTMTYTASFNIVVNNTMLGDTKALVVMINLVIIMPPMGTPPPDPVTGSQVTLIFYVIIMIAVFMMCIVGLLGFFVCKSNLRLCASYCFGFKKKKKARSKVVVNVRKFKDIEHHGDDEDEETDDGDDAGDVVDTGPVQRRREHHPSAAKFAVSDIKITAEDLKKR